MLDIGFSEILLFGVIALVVLGPEKLPVAARAAGRWYIYVRRLVSNLQHDIEKELQLAELREQMQQELARINAVEKQMQTQLDQMHEELNELTQSSASTPAIFYTPLHRASTTPHRYGVPYQMACLLRLNATHPQRVPAHTVTRTVTASAIYEAA